MLTALSVHPHPFVQWGVVLACALAAALTDARSHRIPNGLTGGAWLAGLVAAYAFAGGVGVTDALLGCLIMGTPFVLLWFAGGGAGDAKLMGALGTWLGMSNGLVTLLTVLIVGMIVGLCYAYAKQRTFGVLANLWVMAMGFFGVMVRAHKLADIPDLLPQQETMTPMPYGVSIFLGVCVAAAVQGVRSGGLS